MMMSSRWMFVLSVVAMLSVASCGGGSDSGTGPAPNPPAPPSPSPEPDNQPVEPIATAGGLSFFGDSNAVVGESVGLGVRASDSTDLEEVEWQQMSGPANVNLLAAHTLAVGFDVPLAGDYEFSVNALTASGQTLSASVILTVTSDPTPNVNVRLDHAATERGRVSFRVDAANSKTIDAVTWTQTGGPEAQNVQLDADRPEYIYFDAPSVTADTAITFEAEVAFTDQTVAADDVLLMVQNDTIVADAYFPGNNQIVSADMFAFNSNSPYADEIERCVYTNALRSTCRFGELPLLGQTATEPTVEDVLDRTLVSHAWMGERFRQYLTNSDAGQDMLKLLRATTAVVISYEVRPSFYWTATGAIYLDANNFWQTPQERDTLNDRPDFRSDFGNDLNFVIPWRYVKNNDYYPAGRYPADARLTRSFVDLEASISWLMYHELGHANDFFPPTSWAGLRSSDDPLSYFRNNGASSDQIPVSYPLLPNEMKALAQVSFAGETATSTQRSYRGDDIELFFTPDVAPAYYAYLNEREDFATLFERFMMAYRLGASSDIGIIDTVNNPDVIITWGQRDRISASDLQTRVRFAVENVLPELNVRAIQQQLPAPRLLDPTRSWFDNVNPNGATPAPEHHHELLRLPARRLSDEFIHGPDVPVSLPEQ
ncbi:hypothetical protein [Alteromonas oceanisediminis]|uniref:hypothetical protein n=1 Tax=Alteromonas oceanisediminis TaxID=2836180 RepID=UPI001BDB4649|nr:hypothetical protein [Alteromonas oceanisediminis]MBT0586373.1 hypothetical protein [Alteromonas oceanisediminis]